MMKARMGNKIYKFWHIFYDDVMKLRYQQSTRKNVALNDEVYEDRHVYSLRILYSQNFNMETNIYSKHRNADADNFGLSDFRVSSEDIWVEFKDLRVL